MLKKLNVLLSSYRYDLRYTFYIAHFYFAFTLTLAFSFTAFFYSHLKITQPLWLFLSTVLFTFFTLGNTLKQQCESILQGFVLMCLVVIATTWLGHYSIIVAILLFISCFIVYYYFSVSPKHAIFGAFGIAYLIFDFVSPGNFFVISDRLLAMTLACICVVIAHTLITIVRKLLSRTESLKDWLIILNEATKQLISNPAHFDFSELITQQLQFANFTRKSNITQAILLERITASLLIFSQRWNEKNSPMVQQAFATEFHQFFIGMQQTLQTPQRAPLTPIYEKLEEHFTQLAKEKFFLDWPLASRINLSDSICALQIIAVDLDRLLETPTHV